MEAVDRFMQKNESLNQASIQRNFDYIVMTHFV